MPLPSNLSFVGIAKEATKGTGVASTFYLPVRTLTPIDTVMYLEDTGLRGSMVDIYNEVQGPIYAGFDMDGDVFPDAIGWQLAGVTGDVVTTGASAPFSHTMAVKNSTDGQPTSYSLTDFYGLSGGTPARRFPGMQVAELGLKWSADGLFQWSSKMIGLQSVLVAKPTQSFTTITPLPAWLGALTIGGAGKTFMESGEMTFKRNVTPIHTVDGTQAPYAIWCGALSVAGKVTFVHEDDTELARYLTGTQPIMVLNWQTGAGAGVVQVQVTMSKVQYKVAGIKRSKDYAELEVDFTAIANTTDVGASGGFSQAKVVVQNALPASTYV